MEEKKRNINDIAQEFWQAIEALPIPRMDAVELLDLMDHYSRAGMDFEAELCRRVATRLDPDNMEVAITNVHWEVDNGDWSTIHSLSDSFLEAGYDRYLFDVERWVKIAQPDEAVRFVLEQLPDLCELPEYDFIYDAALLLRDYGYPRQSMQLVRRIPTEYIDYQNVKELMVDDYIALAQYEKAKIILNELIDADPFNKAFWTRLAQINLITEDYAGATDAAEYALAIDKDEEAMRYKNHAYLHQKGRVDTFIKLAALRQDYASCLEVADFLFSKGTLRTSHREL